MPSIWLKERFQAIKFTFQSFICDRVSIVTHHTVLQAVPQAAWAVLYQALCPCCSGPSLLKFQSVCKCKYPWWVNRAHKVEVTESSIYLTKSEDQAFQNMHTLYVYFSFHRFLINKKDNPRLEKGVLSLKLTSVSYYTTRTNFFVCAEKSLSHSITDVFVKSKGRAEKREERETFMIALIYTEW